MGIADWVVFSSLKVRMSVRDVNFHLIHLTYTNVLPKYEATNWLVALMKKYTASVF